MRRESKNWRRGVLLLVAGFQFIMSCGFVHLSLLGLRALPLLSPPSLVPSYNALLTLPHCSLLKQSILGPDDAAASGRC